MAYPTEVNSQITDAVTQSIVEVLASAPAQATSTLYSAVSHSISLAMANAVAAQQNTNVIANAATTRSVALLLQTEAPTLVPAHE
jgi:Killing trait